MEVHPEVYRWLGALHVIDPRAPAPSVTRSGRVMLDEQTSMDFENGQVRAVASPRPFRVVPRPGEYRPTRKLSTCAGDPTPRATRSVAPSRATRARSTLSRVPKRAPSVPRAHPDPATRPPTHLPAGPARRRPSRSHPLRPSRSPLQGIWRAPLQSRRPARHAPRPDRHLQARPIPHRANVQLEPPRSRVPPLRHHPRGRRQGARRRRRPRLRVPHPLQVLRAHRRRSIHDHSPLALLLRGGRARGHRQRRGDERGSLPVDVAPRRDGPERLERVPRRGRSRRGRGVAPPRAGKASRRARAHQRSPPQRGRLGSVQVHARPQRAADAAGAPRYIHRGALRAQARGGRGAPCPGSPRRSRSG